MCATSSKAREGSATAELRSRATKALRPGAISRISGVIPSLAKMPAMYFDAAASLPGGFVVLIWMSCTSHTLASLANSAVFAMEEGFGGATGVDWGIPCADEETVAANQQRAMRSGVPILRFQFTKPSSNLRHPPCPPNLLQQTFCRKCASYEHAR